MPGGGERVMLRGEKKKVRTAEGEKVGQRSLPSCLLRYFPSRRKSEERAENGLFGHVAVGGENVKKFSLFSLFDP